MRMGHPEPQQLRGLQSHGLLGDLPSANAPPLQQARARTHQVVLLWPPVHPSIAQMSLRWARDRQLSHSGAQPSRGSPGSTGDRLPDSQ